MQYLWKKIYQPATVILKIKYIILIVILQKTWNILGNIIV